MMLFELRWVSIEVKHWPHQRWGYSSVAEHSTADREVTGSTPVAPCLLRIQSVLIRNTIIT